MTLHPFYVVDEKNTESIRYYRTLGVLSNLFFYAYQRIIKIKFCIK